MNEQANIAAALVAALADLCVVEKGRTAKIPTKNGKDYSYDYAAIEDVVKVTRPVLASHGIVALTPIHDHGQGLACSVILLHSSGERLDLGPFPFPHGETAQATGSMVTYHRRYALVAALGMAAGDDDDGASAAPRRAPAEPTASPEMHEQIRHIIAVLSDEQTKAFTAWYLGSGLPSIKSADRLTDAQANRVLEHLDRIPADVA